MKDYAVGSDYDLIGYSRDVSADSDAYVDCMNSLSDYDAEDYNYQASKAAIFNGSCSLSQDIDGHGTGTWNFTLSGTSVTATFTNAASPNNGLTVTMTDCKQF